MKNILLLLAGLIWVFASCKKKDPDYAQMLLNIQNKKWVLSYGKGPDSNGNIIVDSVLRRTDYQRDDYITWYPGHAFKVFDNILMNPNPDFTPPMVDSGVYAVSDNLLVVQSEIGGPTIWNFDFEYVTDNEICFTVPFKGHGSTFYYFKRID